MITASTEHWNKILTTIPVFFSNRPRNLLPFTYDVNRAILKSYQTTFVHYPCIALKALPDRDPNEYFRILPLNCFHLPAFYQFVSFQAKSSGRFYSSRR